MSETRIDFLDFLAHVRDQVAAYNMAGIDRPAEIAATITVDYGNGNAETYTVPRMVLYPGRGDVVVTEHATPVTRVPGAFLTDRMTPTGEHILRVAASLHLEPTEPGGDLFTLTRHAPPPPEYPDTPGGY